MESYEYLSKLVKCNPFAGEIYYLNDIPSSSFDTKRGYELWISRFSGKLLKEAVGTDNRIYCRILKKRYTSSRVIWILCNKKDIPKGMQIDHINGVPSDNRISNLRLASRKQNLRNTSPYNASGVKGVYWDKRHMLWYVKMMVNGKTHWFGHFRTKKQAASVAIEKYNEFHGDFSYYKRKNA